MVKLKKWTMAAIDADGIVASTTPNGGGVQSITLDGALTSDGTWTADVPRVIGITSAGNDSGRTFTVTGYNEQRVLTTENITGANADVATSSTVWRSITAITVDDDTAGAITIGTTNAVNSPWYIADMYANPFDIGMVYTTAGATASADVKYTLSDVQDANATINTVAHGTLASLSETNSTRSVGGSQTSVVRALRLEITGFTGGTITFELTQTGIGRG